MLEVCQLNQIYFTIKELSMVWYPNMCYCEEHYKKLTKHGKKWPLKFCMYPIIAFQAIDWAIMAIALPEVSHVLKLTTKCKWVVTKKPLILFTIHLRCSSAGLYKTVTTTWLLRHKPNRPLVDCI